ncbi:MAG TPA: hypothetical protein VLL69_08310 [Streptosporangiaceae bacterium]|nr:hypothetical protein [Streptosporangiaceae bacterium]
MGTRIIIGICAWLLGVVVATGGGLLVVARLGDVLAASPGQLASEAVERPAPILSVRLGVAATPVTRRRVPPPSSPPATAPPSSPPATAPPSPQSAPGSVLTSSGGSVVAGCAAGGAYLLSWSPQQGYQASGVVRGPATTTQVTFGSSQRSVTMLVSCSNGVPSATLHEHGSGGGGDE